VPAASATGRPIDTSRDSDLRRAALELISEIGYDRLTIDAVAARVRAGKATVYRRWASKAELVVDAVAEELFGTLDRPDTGNLRDDLVGIASFIWADQAAPHRAQILAGLMPAMLRDPELREAIKNVSRKPESILQHVVGQAIQRGEIDPTVDTDLIGWVMPSMCMFRLVKTGTPPDQQFLESVIDHIVMPALTKGAK
jgi:AcrR family transcriptional regulator